MFDLLGMLQLEKPVILYQRTVTSFTRTKVTALLIKTPGCNKMYAITQVIFAFQLVLAYDLLEDRRIMTTALGSKFFEFSI